MQTRPRSSHRRSLSLLWRRKLNPLLPRELLLHTPELRREGRHNYLFAFYVCLWCAAFVPCLASFGKEELLRVSKCPTTPTVTSSLLVSSPIPLIVCVELAFSARGMDSSMHCWITALSRRSTPPQRQQKGRLLCLAGGKQLGTDDAGPTDLCGHSYCGDKVLLW